MPTITASVFTRDQRFIVVFLSGHHICLVKDFRVMLVHSYRCSEEIKRMGREWDDS